MRTHIFRTIGLCAVLMAVFLAGCSSSENSVQTNPDEGTMDFTGTQKDYWCAVAPDRLRITSELMLRTRPAKAAVMPIRSPCAHAQLESATLKGQTLDFHKTGRGSYDVNLPSDKQLRRQRQIVFTWLLPMQGLKYESGLYWTQPRSLIPVVSYELRAGAEPQSGFEVFGETEEGSPVAYSWDFAAPTNDFGRGECALPLRPRK